MSGDIHRSITAARPTATSAVSAISRPDLAHPFNRRYITVDIRDRDVDHATAASAEATEAMATIGGDTRIDQKRLDIDLRGEHPVEHATISAVSGRPISAQASVDDQISSQNELIRQNVHVLDRTTEAANPTIRSITRDDLQIGTQQHQICHGTAIGTQRVSNGRPAIASENQNIVVRRKYLVADVHVRHRAASPSSSTWRKTGTAQAAKNKNLITAHIRRPDTHFDRVQRTSHTADFSSPASPGTDHHAIRAQFPRRDHGRSDRFKAYVNIHQAATPAADSIADGIASRARFYDDGKRTIRTRVLDSRNENIPHSTTDSTIRELKRHIPRSTSPCEKLKPIRIASDLNIAQRSTDCPRASLTSLKAIRQRKDQ